jgi:hypothetical protein
VIIILSGAVPAVVGEPIEVLRLDGECVLFCLGKLRPTTESESRCLTQKFHT